MSSKNSGSLLLNRAGVEGSNFHLSLALCTGSRRQGITIKLKNILFFYPANLNPAKAPKCKSGGAVTSSEFLDVVTMF